MGLAASQARLLSLTARQHTVEHRAQVLQAQKLSLANDSDSAYEKYINALDATQVQTRVYDSNGKAHWLDASLNNVMRYDFLDTTTTGNTYYVQDVNTGKMYVQSKISNAYNKAIEAGDNVLNFMDELNIKYTENAYRDEYLDAYNVVEKDKELGYNIPYDNMEEYTRLKAAISYPNPTETYNIGDAIYSIVKSSKPTGQTHYLPSSENAYTELMGYLNSVKNTEYYRNNADVKKIIDYCTSFDTPSGVIPNTGELQEFVARGLADNSAYIFWNKETEETKDQNTDQEALKELLKLKLLLNGGSYTSEYKETITETHQTNNGGNFYTITKDVTKTNEGEIYSEDIKDTINNYVIAGSANIGDALIKIGNEIKASESNKEKEVAVQAFEAFLTANNTTEEAIETQIKNYNKYCEDLAALNAADSTTYTKYEKGQAYGEYHEALYYAIKSAGGCIELSEENSKSTTWITNMLKNGQIVLATYNTDKKELNNISTSTNRGLREITNETEIAKADSEYEAALEDIDAKDKQFNIQLNKLESERNAIQTEIESLKKIAKENIDSTFKTFS